MMKARFSVCHGGSLEIACAARTRNTYLVEVPDSRIYPEIKVFSRILLARDCDVPSVFGNAFSNRRAKSGSFSRAFMSVITCYRVWVGT